MSIKKQAIRGVKWTTAGTIVLALSGLLKISILARFLDKEDFGLMALVSFVLGFMTLFMDMGLTSAILHKQEINKNEYSSLYWINILFSIALFFIIGIFAPVIANFYDESQLSLLIPLMGFIIIFSALGRQFKTVEQKEMNHKYISITDSAGAIAGLIASIILAIYGFGVFALVYAALIQHFVSNSIYFIKGLKTHPLSFHFSYKETKPFLNIGIYYTGSQLLNYLNRDFDVLIIGKFFSTEILGGYSLAKQLIRRPIQIINPIINKVGVSVLPKFQNDLISLRKYFTKLFEGMGILNAVIYGLSAIFAPYLVLLFYGPNFSSITIYIQIFSLLMFLRSMAGTVGILTITTGRTDFDFYWNIMTIIVMPLVIYWGAFYSIEVIIVLMIVMQLILLIPGWFIFYKKFIGLKLVTYLNHHFTPMIIAIGVFSLSQIWIVTNLSWLILVGLLLIVSLGVYSFFTVTEFKNFIIKLFKKYNWI